MRRYRIVHNTLYHFAAPVQLLPHTLRLRPREGHELRIESSTLTITPDAKLRWHRDVEGNCVATAHFVGMAPSLGIHSQMIIQQYDQQPHDFLVADYAVNYPFCYLPEEGILLASYLTSVEAFDNVALDQWLAGIWQPGERIQTVALLLRLNEKIHATFRYQRREEEGVQTAAQTLFSGAGSCRDFANLLMTSARKLGLAARFVSGYLYTSAATAQSGSTHAWAEVFIPGAGWKGFDPTIGKLAGPHHIAVAVARMPQSVPPVAGAYQGAPGATMAVEVRVVPLD